MNDTKNVHSWEDMPRCDDIRVEGVEVKAWANTGGIWVELQESFQVARNIFGIVERQRLEEQWWGKTWGK